MAAAVSGGRFKLEQLPVVPARNCGTIQSSDYTQIKETALRYLPHIILVAACWLTIVLLVPSR